MTKKNKQQPELNADTQPEEKQVVDTAEAEIAGKENQRDETSQNRAKNDRTFSASPADDSRSETKKRAETPDRQTAAVKKSGSGLAWLAILIALALGAAGYYFGQQEADKIQQKLTALESKIPAGIDLPAPPDFDRERARLEDLTKNYRTAADKIAALEHNLTTQERDYSGLRAELNKLRSQATPAQPNDWLLSEADFLLTNAQRKLTLDNDVDTSVALLKVADETLSKVTDPHAAEVRAAIGNDLKQLLSLNNVDQNAVMQRLSQLANTIDELEVLDIDFDRQENGTDVSDSVSDWQTNMKKSAKSFLNHFITVTPRNSQAKELLAPNQDIYLRENIRLRLQIAILAVPRQQSDLYKQSLETVASWVRSYFNTNSEAAAGFLKSVDELAEQSIYVDVPDQLSSLTLLDKILDKPTRELRKIELSADKELMRETDEAESKAETPAGETSKPAEAENTPQPQ